jgi:WD40 repeat protein
MADPRATTSPIRETRVFVSYSRKDLEAADSVVAALRARGYVVSIDRDDIAPAEVFRERIEQLILTADVVVLIVSPDAIRSEICAWEVAQTLAYGKKLVPLIRRNVDAADCPPGLADRNWVGSPNAWDESGLSVGAMEKLIVALDLDLHWERHRTVWLDRAVRWSRAGRPAGRLLRAEELADAEAWGSRRPPKAAALPAVLFEYFASSAERVRADRDRLRSITGRAFVMPIAQALARYEPDRALRMLAMAVVLVEDPRFEVVPQLWTEGARCLTQVPICSIVNEIETVSTEPYHEDKTLFAVSPDATLAALHDVRGRVTLFELQRGKRVWSTAVGTEPHELHVTGSFGVVAISKNGDVLRLAQSSGAIEGRGSFGAEISGGLTTVVPEAGALLAAAGPAILRYDLASGAISEMHAFQGQLYGFDYCYAKQKGVALVDLKRKWIAETFGACASRRYELEGDDIYHASFSRDGSTLCLADSFEATVYESEANSPRIRVRHSGKISTTGYEIDTVSLSDDGGLLLTSAHDGTARVWDTASGAELHRFDHVNEALITTAGFGPDCKSVFTVGTDCSVRVWSMKTSEDVVRIDDRHNGPSTLFSNNGIRGAGLSHDGARLWIQFMGGLAQVWPCAQWQELPFPAAATMQDGRQPGITSLQCIGTAYFGISSSDGRYRVLNLENGATTSELDLKMEPDRVLTIEDHKVVVAARGSATFAASLSSGQSVWERHHPQRIETMAFVPRTDVLVIGGGAHGSGEGFVDFMRVGGEMIQHSLMRGWTSAICWHRERRSILIGDVAGYIQEWTEDALAYIRCFDPFTSKIEAIAIPPEGKHFYVASDDSVWRVGDDNLRTERIFALRSGVNSMCCEPHDRVLFIEGVHFPYFVDLQRSALLLEGRPSAYDGIEPETFEKSFVLPDWSAFIGVTNKGRWLRRGLTDVMRIAESPARSIAAALGNGNEARRATERLDVLMSEQPEDLAARVSSLVDS